MTENKQEESSNTLKRTLASRHLTMISIGGAIGTGLFVASGATISTAGPGGALIAYTLIGFMVYLLMQSLGEMATYMPVSGSFGEYGRRFISPSFGFALGWNYWYNWAITVAAELSAAALVMKYWFPNTPGWIWSLIFLVLLVVLNALSARAYGEGEFWFSVIKVVTVIIFLILGILTIIGIIGGHNAGFTNWVTGQAPFVNGGMGILAIFMVAGFSFQGTELVGVAAGEADNPEKTVPHAIRTIFWRILLFYIGTIIVIGFLIPYTDPNLLDSDVSSIAISPFTLVFQRAGVAAAAAIMNAVILTSVLSAGNSGLYASTRMLYALAKNGDAPKIFTHTSKHGVPVNALIVTTLIGAA
ncbi:MAG: amino acid permease, partial [Bifidobacteriaceae bacterium]|nr:amino acid permease [Bifidobacteriaceae bacterium]